MWRCRRRIELKVLSVGRFIGDGEQGLELRSLGFLVDDGGLHFEETGFLKHGFKFGLAEA